MLKKKMFQQIRFIDNVIRDKQIILGMAYSFRSERM